jgi:phosphoribosylformimino-5-aminoimidazole carboxamide ribotide isomerase
MRIVPVLDVMNGAVVRGVAGRRAEYRPIVSRLTTSTRPLDVARAFREHFGLTELYLADLDAIAGQPPAFDLYFSLQADAFRLAVDAGLRDTSDGEVLAESGVNDLVAGLETLAGPTVLTQICERVGGSRVIFSLDLKFGLPLGDLQAWERADPMAIAGRAVASGVKRLIVLDLGRVGVGEGTGTVDLCRELVKAFPQIEVFAGGGLRDPDDLRCLRDCGVSGVLIASALHDGRLARSDLTLF